MPPKQESNTRNRNNENQKEESQQADDATTQKRRLVIVAAIAVALFSAGIHRVVLTFEESPVDHQSNNHVRKAFVEWFHKMGGQLSPNVKLAFFNEYGYGLAAVLGKQENEHVIQRGDQLLIVPESIQFSSELTMRRFGKINPKLAAFVSETISRYYPSSLERQDALIAVALMVECSLGTASMFYPYISILPQSVARLDTFNDAQLELLQDPSLSSLARQSRLLLQTLYDAIQLAARDLSSKATAHDDTAPNEACLSFSSFHRFVSIVSSHAMILNNTKYLVPMADMINHAVRPTDGGVVATSFADYHVRNIGNGDITVLADRLVKAKHQIFEEYGQLDNSLYLLAHGFVPDSNPHHCAMLPRKHLPTMTHPILLNVLKELGILLEVLESICVFRDGTAMDDPNKSVAAYLALSNLEHDDSKQLKRCVHAMDSGMYEHIKAECIEYPQHKNVAMRMLQKIVQAILAGADTTLEEDVALLRQYTELKAQPRTLLALQFRIADKQVLYEICRDI